MKIQLNLSKLDQIKAGVIVVPVYEGDFSIAENSGIEIIKSFLKENAKFGKLYETQLLFDPQQKYFLVGAGKKDEFDYEKAQNLGGTVVRSLIDRTKEIAYFIQPEIIEPTALGVELAAHDPSQLYRTDKEKPVLEIVQLIIDKNTKESQDALKKGIVLADAINIARMLGDMPANEMTPTYFLNVVKKVTKENKLKLTILDEKQAKKKGMGAFTGVAQGSDEPSYMIALEYKGDIRAKDKWGFVGKGITFDSGGVSIKPSDSMHEMKYDMSGAAVVLATLQASARLKLKANLVGIMAVTENLPGGKAQRPGDIVKTYSGKTAEVLNTDAEGRLVLADALTFAQRDFKVTKIVDLATLTGAIIVALGDLRAGVFTNNNDFANELIKAGEKIGEKYWLFPMDQEYGEMIKSDFADIANIGHGSQGSRAAGSITGAKFLEAVIEDDRPWIHLDIAGTAWDTKPKPYRGAGATGFGVKTLIELIS